MLRTLPLILILLGTLAQAQDTRYISDKQFIPVRSGAGNQFRIIHRGLPSGTRLIVKRIDGDWAEISTEGGIDGWVRAQYLMSDLPAQNKLDAAVSRAETLAAQNAELKQQLQALRAEKTTLEGELGETSAQLGQVSDEFTQLKQISGKAVQLDTDNRRLVESAENLRSEVEMLEVENQRLQDKLDSEAFMNGALAVLLGVVITLVVPRLWPKKRRSSSWA